MATPANADIETAGAPALPSETAATAEQAVKKKTTREEAHKAQLAALKRTVQQALGADDSSVAIALSRIEKRFEE